MVPLLAGRPLSVKRCDPGRRRSCSATCPRRAGLVRTVPCGRRGRTARSPRCCATTGARCCGWPTSAPSSSTSFFRAGDAEADGSGARPRPARGADFPVVVRAARLVRRARGRGAVRAVKTSGSKGVHVVVPVRGAPFEDVAAATRALAARTERLDPELATTAYIKEDGTGGSSSIRPGRVRTRSWPPTAPHPARTSGVRAGRLGRPGRRLARGLHGDGRGPVPDGVGGRAARAAGAAGRPGGGGPHDPHRPGGGDARGASAGSGPPSGGGRRS